MLHLQQPLFPTTSFTSSRPGPNHYVLVLKTRRGEIRALESVRPGDLLTPLIEVDVRLAEDDNPTSKAVLTHLPDQLATSLGSRLFFLDLTWLPVALQLRPLGHRQRFADEYIVEECWNRGLPFVPLVTPSTKGRRLDLLREGQCDGHGMALRLRLGGAIQPHGGLAGLIDELLSRIRLTLNGLDPVQGLPSAA